MHVTLIIVCIFVKFFLNVFIAHIIFKIYIFSFQFKNLEENVFVLVMNFTKHLNEKNENFHHQMYRRIDFTTILCKLFSSGGVLVPFIERPNSSCRFMRYTRRPSVSSLWRQSRCKDLFTNDLTQIKIDRISVFIIS